MPSVAKIIATVDRGYSKYTAGNEISA